MFKRIKKKFGIEKQPIDKLKDLIKIASEDGVISDREIKILLRKAKKLDIDIDEAELLIINASNKLKNVDSNDDQNEETIIKDGFDISDEELLLRTKKWVSLTKQSNYKGIVKPFPRQTGNLNRLSKSLNVGKKVLGSVANNFTNKLSLANPFNYIKAVNQIANGGDIEKRLEHNEIEHLAKSYLIILELRGENNDFLKQKFLELLQEIENNIANRNSNKWSLW